MIEDRGVYELWEVRWKECLCEGVIVNVKRTEEWMTWRTGRGSAL
jgi:hypothetical protein